MIVDKAPCKICTKRHMNCHATCDDYKIWRRILDEDKRNIVNARDKELELREIKFSAIERLKVRR